MNRGWVKYVMQHWVGISDIPQLSTINLRRELDKRNARWLTELEWARLRASSKNERSLHVILLQDAFTTFYEPHVVLATYDLIVKMGLVPLVVAFFPNGKALSIKGFLSIFRHIARRNTARLNHLAELDIPIVGIEPAVVLTYRDEYPELLGQDAIRFRVELLQDWLDTERHRLEALAPANPNPAQRPVLFGHCTERTAAPLSQAAWVRVFQAANLNIEVASVGCCGMCGVFGHETAHVVESKSIYQMSWQPKLCSLSPERIALVTGHSCRSQLLRTDATKSLHPAELLLRQMAHR